MNFDSHEGFLKLKVILSQFRIELSLITVSLVLTFTALMLFLHTKNLETTPMISMSSGAKKADLPKKTKTIFIHLDGAVEDPDVYEVTEGARLKDVLVLANGLSKQADRNIFSRNFNLAQILADQQKIYIPAEGEVAAVADQQSSQQSIISINTASQQVLEGLPGIGPVTAEKIISGRPYNQVDQLLSRKIIGPAMFEKLKSLISL